MSSIQKIQLKRGAKNVLEAVLKDNMRPALGEPIYEVDTKQLKIGDGINDYKDLEYYGGEAKAQKLTYNSIYDLPTTGTVGTIYVILNGNTYIWDSEKLHYKVLYVDNRQFYSLMYNDSGEIVGAERQIDAGNASADYKIENFTITK